jgi:hypothetical protein
LNEFASPAYKRPFYEDKELSAQLRSSLSQGRTASLSDFRGLKGDYSPKDKFRAMDRKHLATETKTSFTPPAKQLLPPRPRSALVDRYAKPSPPFQRPRNPVAKTIENEYPTKPSASTLPRSFKDATQLFEDLGITGNVNSNHPDGDNTKNQSFRLPDMTGIHSLINTTPKRPEGKRSKYVPIKSIPVPKDEEGFALVRVFNSSNHFRHPNFTRQGQLSHVSKQ